MTSVFSKLLNQAMKERELAMTVDIANLVGNTPVLLMNGRRQQRNGYHNTF